jgi:hypothetical protein
MDSVWDFVEGPEGFRQQSWFFRLGRGASFRGLNLPLVLTRNRMTPFLFWLSGRLCLRSACHEETARTAMWVPLSQDFKGSKLVSFRFPKERVRRVNVRLHFRR